MIIEYIDFTNDMRKIYYRMKDESVALKSGV
jgi:hypothetical protein